VLLTGKPRDGPQAFAFVDYDASRFRDAAPVLAATFHRVLCTMLDLILHPSLALGSWDSSNNLISFNAGLLDQCSFDRRSGA
jgi:hypothetical protein